MTSALVAEKVDRATFENEIKPLNRPVILKGLAKSWPSVALAAQSPQALAGYLKMHDKGAPQKVAVCPAAFNGRYFYNAEMTGFNFSRTSRTLSQIIDLCLAAGEGNDSYYLEAAHVDGAVPDLGATFSLPLIDATIRPRMWLGTSLRTQTHFDMYDNIAVHVAGEKVFTLFPPDQIGNLYPGPIDLTPAGVPISMVSLEAPDFDLYPRFHDALDAAQEARLEPGDALYMPALWWHHVSTRGPLNMLVNFWWTERRNDAYSPINALYMAALSYKHMPATERKNWAALVNYYVFEEAGDPVAHLPARLHNVFGSDPTPREMEQFKATFRRSVRL
jgi:hypothetical protein